jgi:hypothetical protein
MCIVAWPEQQPLLVIHIEALHLLRCCRHSDLNAAGACGIAQSNWPELRILDIR